MRQRRRIRVRKPQRNHEEDGYVDVELEERETVDGASDEKEQADD